VCSVELFLENLKETFYEGYRPSRAIDCDNRYTETKPLIYTLKEAEEGADITITAKYIAKLCTLFVGGGLGTKRIYSRGVRRQASNVYCNYGDINDGLE